jgi:hypothetical protein
MLVCVCVCVLFGAFSCHLCVTTSLVVYCECDCSGFKDRVRKCVVAPTFDHLPPKVKEKIASVGISEVCFTLRDCDSPACFCVRLLFLLGLMLFVCVRVLRTYVCVYLLFVCMCVHVYIYIYACILHVHTPVCTCGCMCFDWCVCVCVRVLLECVTYVFPWCFHACTSVSRT